MTARRGRAGKQCPGLVDSSWGGLEMLPVIASMLIIMAPWAYERLGER